MTERSSCQKQRYTSTLILYLVLERFTNIPLRYRSGKTSKTPEGLSGPGFRFCFLFLFDFLIFVFLLASIAARFLVTFQKIEPSRGGTSSSLGGLFFFSFFFSNFFHFSFFLIFFFC